VRAEFTVTKSAADGALAAGLPDVESVTTTQ
jgi:hypothetical protein